MGSTAERAQLYQIDVPGYRKSDLSRSSYTIPMMPPHEVMAETLRDPKYLKKVEEFVSSQSMPPAYEQHVVVQRARQEDPDAIVPALCLYMGAVPYSQSDGVLGIWIECMATQSH